MNMISRVAITLLVCVFGFASARASAREELLFNLNTALKTRDGAGFAHCFNFRGADEATRQSMIKIISQILAWPSFDLFTSERTSQGDPKFDQGGEAFTLNGEWKYQVHIFLSKATPKGFVFPAGSTAGGQDLILIPVPAKAAPAAKSTPKPKP